MPDVRSPAPDVTERPTEAARRLDFLVVGAQKCATSWLYLCLRDHPGLHLPARKREREYVGGALYRERGPAWWFGRLDGARPDQAVGDVSVDYLVDPASPGRVAGLAPGVRAVASLREPVARALSAHAWYLRRGLVDEHDPAAALRRALDDEDAGRDTPYADLLRRGLYDDQLRRYVDTFGAERLQVVLYEEIAADPADVLRRVYRFLGVDPAVVPASLGDRPKQNTRSRLIVGIERLAPRSPLFAGLGDLLHRRLARTGLAPDAPVLPADLRAALDDRFAPHVAGLADLLADLPSGSRPRLDLADAWSV